MIREVKKLFTSATTLIVKSKIMESVSDFFLLLILTYLFIYIFSRVFKAFSHIFFSEDRGFAAIYSEAHADEYADENVDTDNDNDGDNTLDQSTFETVIASHNYDGPPPAYELHAQQIDMVPNNQPTGTASTTNHWYRQPSPIIGRPQSQTITSTQIRQAGQFGQQPTSIIDRPRVLVSTQTLQAEQISQSMQIQEQIRQTQMAFHNRQPSCTRFVPMSQQDYDCFIRYSRVERECWTRWTYFKQYIDLLQLGFDYPQLLDAAIHCNPM